MWRDKLTPDGQYDDGYRHMCTHGIREYRAGRCDAIRFEVLNSQEHEPIRELMVELAPDVPFYFNTLLGGAAHTSFSNVTISNRGNSNDT